MVFQEPSESLNPRFTSRTIVEELGSVADELTSSLARFKLTD